PAVRSNPLKRRSEARALVRRSNSCCWRSKSVDPFEPIRTRAAALHQELVSEGEDPFDPLGLIQAAVARCELDLVFLPSGDPALKGARAIFDHQGGTVCCEEETDPATRALLVAHELGHSELHAGSATCAGSDI